MKTVAFVEQLYTKFLGRGADASGRAYWSRQLDDGNINAAQATLAFINGQEFAGLAIPIARLYYASFGRIPDAAGLSFWLAQAKKGASLVSIGADFMRSTEFQTLYGKSVTDTAFIDLLYKNVLGRTADAEGKVYWLNKLTVEKVARANVLNAFSDSPELISAKNEEIKVIVQYQSIADITPSKTEIAAALAQNDAVALITKLYASSTYSGVAVPYLNQKGVVVDGYLSGATLFVDRNGNHILDANETRVSTDVQGNFSFKDKESFNGILVTQGGLDIATKNSVNLSYTAPAGANVISPLTTLLEKISSSKKISLPDAANVLIGRLGVDSGVNVLEFDPVAQAVKSGASAEQIAVALQAQDMAAQINLTANLIATTLLAAGATRNVQQASDAAFDAIVRLLLTEGQASVRLDLGDASLVIDLLSTAALLLSADTPSLITLQTIRDPFATILANLNQAMAGAIDGNALSSLIKIAQIAYVAESIAKNLGSDVADADITTSLNLASNPALSDAIAAAPSKLGQITQDIIAPTLVSSTPADNASPVLFNSNIVLKFSENVYAGSGNIVITDGKDSRTIAVTDKSQVTFDGDTVTINPTRDFNGGTSYNVTMASGVINDRVGNHYAGISDPTALNFSVPLGAIKLGSLDGSTGSRYEGVAPNGLATVSSGGDVNGDGFADFIAGAGSDTNAGSSYLLLGKSGTYAAINKLSTLDAKTGSRFDGVAAEDFSGSAVSIIGDINGDGLADLLIGAPGAAPSSKAFAGSSYVVFGKTSAFSSPFKLSTLNGSTGFRLDSAIAGEWSGSAVSGAGDVNGDGLDDFLIGASGSNNNTGAAYLVFGKAGTYLPTMSLASLNGNNGMKLTGIGNNDAAGAAVASAGDFNGDGFDDFLVGGYAANADAGAAWLVFGKADGFSASMSLSSLDGSNGIRLDGVTGENLGRSLSRAGDINGDGLEDLIVGAFHANGNAGASYVLYGKSEPFFDASFKLSSVDGSNGFTVLGDVGNDLSGISVSRAGDVNGDGIDDLLIGARDARTQAGSTYLVFGRKEGLGERVYLSNINGINGMRLDGVIGDLAGGTVSGVGDVNGDGYDDLAISAAGAQSGVGSSYVFFGGNFSNVVNFKGTTKVDTVTGTSAAEIIMTGQGNDIITLGGGADVLRAGPGDDTISISSLDFALIDGGGGKDTLKFTGEGMDLNLQSIPNAIKNIEAINLLGSGANSVTLTARDVTRLSSSSNTLTITGDANDTVHLVGAWIPDLTNKNGANYHLGQAIVIVGGTVVVDNG